MKKILSLAAIALLSACASPTFNMHPQEIAALSDDQLCTYKNNYRTETNLEAEINRRGLNCNRYHRECLRRGNKAGTEAMAFCEELMRQNERLRYDRRYYDGFSMYGHRGYYGGRGHSTGVGVGLGF